MCQKERTRKTPDKIWQSDHHKLMPRPDVEGIFFEPKATVRRRRDMQFFITVLKPNLRKIKPLNSAVEH